MKIKFTKFKTEEVEVDVTLLPEGTSYWKLDKYCSPYKTQFIRVTVEGDVTDLLVVQIARLEVPIIRLHKFGNREIGEFIRGSSREYDYLCEGLKDLLFFDVGEHKTGCVEISRISEEEFVKQLNSILY